jgi:hypothetical protein
MKATLVSIFFSLMILVDAAHAGRTLEQLIQVMKRNQSVTCEVTAWREGPIDPFTGKRKVIYEKILPPTPPVASSSNDFATYELEMKGQQVYFRYHMNSQTGAIELVDKTTGANARAELDISDLDKDELLLGHVEFFANSQLMLLGSKDVRSLWAECHRARQP